MSVQNDRDTLSYDLWHRKDLYTYFASILTDQVKLRPDIIEINKVKFDLTKKEDEGHFVYFLNCFNQINLSTLQALSRSAKIRLRCDPKISQPFQSYITILQIDFDFGKYLNTLLQVADNNELLDTFNSILLIRQGLNPDFYHENDKLNQGRNNTDVNQLKQNFKNLKTNSLTENKHEPINDHFDNESNDQKEQRLNDRLQTAIASANQETKNDNVVTHPQAKAAEKVAAINKLKQEPTNKQNDNQTVTAAKDDSDNPLMSNNPFGQDNDKDNSAQAQMASLDELLGTQNDNSQATPPSQPYVDSGANSAGNNDSISVPLNATENNSLGSDGTNEAAAAPDEPANDNTDFNAVLNGFDQDNEKDQDESQTNRPSTNFNANQSVAPDQNLAQNNQQVINKVKHNEDGDIIDDSDIPRPNSSNYTADLENKLNRINSMDQPEVNSQDHPSQFKAQLSQEDTQLAEILKRL